MLIAVVSDVCASPPLHDASMFWQWAGDRKNKLSKYMALCQCWASVEPMITSIGPAPILCHVLTKR